MADLDWEMIGIKLREPFDPRDIDFRVQGKQNEQTGKAQVVAYLDARAVQDRLDAVVGAGNWSFDWQPLVIDKGDVQVAKGTITICGVSKADAGTASNFEATLGAVSHCFKRAAVQWGIGRYLYALPGAWVQVEKGGRISDAVLRELRAKLPRPPTTTGVDASVVTAALESRWTRDAWRDLTERAKRVGVQASMFERVMAHDVVKHEKPENGWSDDDRDQMRDYIAEQERKAAERIEQSQRRAS